MPEWKPIRPVLLEDDLGSAGWAALHERAELLHPGRTHGAAAQAEVLALLRYAVYDLVIRRVDVRLTDVQISELLRSSTQQLESVA